MRSIEVTVDSIAYGGKGVARYDGKVYFVSGGIPGDRLRLKVVAEKGRYGEADIAEIIEPSHLRGHPPCPVFTECGGCQWQGIDLSVQQEWKQHFVLSALQRIGHTIPPEDLTFHPSPEAYNYRSRIFLRCHGDQHGYLTYGFFKQSSRTLIAIRQCLIADPSINLFLKTLDGINDPSLSDIRFRLELQRVPAMEDRIFITVFPSFPEEKRRLIDLVKLWQNHPLVAWCGFVSDQAQANFFPFETSEGLTYHSSPGQFQQVYLRHNHVLRRLVAAAIEGLQPSSVLDLYCGSGNLTLQLIPRGISVTGVESNPRSIACAKKNLEVNHLEGRFIAEDTYRWLKANGRTETFDVVVVDPPREGMKREANIVASMARKAILYVSCDPTTLARDIAVLRNSGFHLSKIQALDFFPQTYHVESIALLVRQ